MNQTKLNAGKHVIKQKLQSLKQILLYFLTCPILDKIKF